MNLSANSIKKHLFIDIEAAISNLNINVAWDHFVTIPWYQTVPEQVF